MSSEEGISESKEEETRKPICLIILGMAGAGKTSFTRHLAGKVVEGSRPYLINLDPACREVPYPANIDRHTTSPELVRERAALAELLETMTLGQLLPHPLGHMLELAPELTASEIVQMLRDCLWNYTRDHVPSPALFTCDSTGLHWRDPSTCKPPANYTDTLRLIIQKRISKLGHMYPIMFLNLEKETQ